jgi:hypothetical protein
MGPKQTSSSENKKEIDEKKHNLPDSSNFHFSNYYKDNNSSYNGLKSFASSESESDSASSKKNNYFEELENVGGVYFGERAGEKGGGTRETGKGTVNLSDRVTTNFFWNEGGNEVFLTGSFSQWTQWFIMKKIKPDEFEITLELQKGVHQFKFVIDNTWKTSKNYEIIKDEKGNVNNVLDNSKYIKSDHIILDYNVYHKEDIFHKCKTKFNKIKSDKQNKSKSSQNIKFSYPNEYCNYVPKISEMNCGAPVLPIFFNHPFKLSSNANEIEPFTKTYLKIFSPPHINIYHFLTYIHTRRNDKSIKVSCVSRVKNKYITIIYYKPLCKSNS